VLKNMKLSLKIIMGFVLVLLIAVAIGTLAYINMSNAKGESEILSDEYIPEMEIASNIERTALQAFLEYKAYNYSEDISYYNKGKEYMVSLNEYIEKGKGLANKYPRLNELGVSIEKIDTIAGRFGNLADQTAEEYTYIKENRIVFEEAAANYMDASNNFLENQQIALNNGIDSDASVEELKERLSKITLINKIINLANSIRVSNYKSQALGDNRLVEEALLEFDKMDVLFEQLLALAKTQENLLEVENMRTAANNFKNAMEAILASNRSMETISNERETLAGEMLQLAGETSTSGMEDAINVSDENVSSLSNASSAILIIVIIGILIGVLAAYLIIKSITKPINRISSTLREGADQVAAASEQLSSASQQLAEGSSEQASSLEETSSTLEESASMIRQNSENTKQAALLSKQAKDAATAGNAEMEEMIDSMTELKKSSDEISKIIKVIDDIAFQTNILALNAAVEAARAGDAGMGFAVVAEEVRNLAQRSAQAAKDTASIIENNISLAQKGINVTERVNESLTEINNQSQKVNELMDEVVAASEEQTEGISQINTAVSQMDEVVQENAAAAEESASASEELSAQAKNMKNSVALLISLVEGASNVVKNNIVQQNEQYLSEKQNKDSRSPQKNHNYTEKDTVEVSPEDVIPLEDDAGGF